MQTQPSPMFRAIGAICLLGALVFYSACGPLDCIRPCKKHHATADAGAVTPGARPADVPQEYVVTASGWFHPACVVELGVGESLRVDGTIEGADGRVRPLGSCAQPHFDLEGNLVEGPGAHAVALVSEDASDEAEALQPAAR